MIRLVIVESPFAGDVKDTTAYAVAACLDCIQRDETPFASHLLYPQILNDDDPCDREAGIRLGYDWGMAAAKASTTSSDEHPNFTFLIAFYVDKGWSPGMERALEFYTARGFPCEVRRLDAEKSTT
jgi:hypothetical protein